MFSKVTNQIKKQTGIIVMLELKKNMLLIVGYFRQKSTGKNSNFLFEYRREIEATYKNTLTCPSGAHMWWYLLHHGWSRKYRNCISKKHYKKIGWWKSRDTIPLKTNFLRTDSISNHKHCTVGTFFCLFVKGTYVCRWGWSGRLSGRRSCWWTRGQSSYSTIRKVPTQFYITSKSMLIAHPPCRCFWSIDETPCLKSSFGLQRSFKSDYGPIFIF